MSSDGCHDTEEVLLFSSSCVVIAIVHCRLKPEEAWVGEMVIRLHEATSGSLSPEDDGTGAEE